METGQPLFDLNKTAKDLIESNNHVDWSAFSLSDRCVPINAVQGPGLQGDRWLVPAHPGERVGTSLTIKPVRQNK